MSFKKYLLDKTVQITVSIVGFIIAILMLNAFKVENDLKIALTILFFLVATFNIIFDYFSICYLKPKNFDKSNRS